MICHVISCIDYKVQNHNKSKLGIPSVRTSERPKFKRGPFCTIQKLFWKRSNEGTATWVQKDSWLVLKPPPCCLFARHSVLKIAIHCSFAHHYAQPRKRSDIVHVWGARKFLLKVNTSQMSNKKTWPNFPWNTGRFKNQDPYFMAYEIIPIWTWVP